MTPGVPIYWRLFGDYGHQKRHKITQTYKKCNVTIPVLPGVTVIHKNIK